MDNTIDYYNKNAGRFIRHTVDVDFSSIQKLFQDLEEVDVYDGIWACSSILHLNKSELAGVFRKMYTAVKKHGIIYTSFKYGDYPLMTNIIVICI